MVVGGSFTSVTQTRTSAAVTRNRVFAFNATTGALVTSFAPNLDGPVNTLLAGPNGDSVSLGGAFNTVNRAASRKFAQPGDRRDRVRVQGAGHHRPLGQRSGPPSTTVALTVRLLGRRSGSVGLVPGDGVASATS